jgi:hypothetical protein
VYLRYRENDAWHMRDFAEYFPIHFHSEGTIGVPIPKQQQPVAGGDLAVRPSSLGDREIRSLNLSFKRKEHYWRYRPFSSLLFSSLLFSSLLFSSLQSCAVACRACASTSPALSPLFVSWCVSLFQGGASGCEWW